MLQAGALLGATRPAPRLVPISAFKNEGLSSGSSYNKDHSLLESILGPLRWPPNLEPNAYQLFPVTKSGPIEQTPPELKRAQNKGAEENPKLKILPQKL